MHAMIAELTELTVKLSVRPHLWEPVLQPCERPSLCSKALQLHWGDLQEVPRGCFEEGW